VKIVFMGTPDFARKSLQQLYDDGHEIAAVFTGADKKQGRGMKLTYTPVKELALQHNTPVFEPSEMTASLVESFKCELIAVVAYGVFLPQSILDIPPLGCVNIHGSLLPKYRGAAPIQHAVLNGEKITGVTSQFMVKQMDAGDVILSSETKIGEDETSAQLFERLGDMGAKLLSDTVFAIEKGAAPRVAQNHDEATFAPVFSKDNAAIDFNETAVNIKNKVRAFVPWPVATMELSGKVLKVYSVDISDNQTGRAPGTAITDSKLGLEIACKDGSVIINRLQASGGKIMSSSEYLRGNKTNET